MTVDRTPSPAAASRAFRNALVALHRRAGEPSSRAMASAMGEISHTTVNAAIKGPKIPSWPIVARIVDQLDGDIEEFRYLWGKARNTEDASTIGTSDGSPNDQSSAEVSVFVSYARIDDQATYGRISKMIQGVANSYSSLTGRGVGIFQDVDSIAPGDEWKSRIRLGLSSSSIFLAFVTPAYLRSAACREELNEFLEFLDVASTTRLVIPLVFAEKDRIERTFADDQLWQRLGKLNRMDISQLRFMDEGTSDWSRAVQSIAERIDDVFNSVNQGVSADSKSARPELDQEPEAAGILEHFAAIEESGPLMLSNLNRFGELMAELGEETTTESARLGSATTFGQRLAVSRRLGEKLQPIADEMEDTALDLLRQFDDWIPIVRFALDYAERQNEFPLQESDSQDGSGVAVFLSSVREMAVNGVEAVEHVESLRISANSVIGVSRYLDRPLKKVQSACLHMADLRGILNNWMDEINALESIGGEAR